jgi:hypothetical protein
MTILYKILTHSFYNALKKIEGFMSNNIVPMGSSTSSVSTPNVSTSSLPKEPPPFFSNFDNDNSLENRTIKLIDYESIFRTNLSSFINENEKLEKSARFKATLLKVLFVVLLVVGIICAASFFLLPLLGNIAAALGISVAITKTVWQVIFLSGGLMAGFSFIPRRFVKGFQEDQEHYHHKAETLKQQLLQAKYFEKFLKEELIGKNYKHTERIAASYDFAELYHLFENLNKKMEKLREFENNRNQLNILAIPDPDNAAPKDIPEKFHKLDAHLREMKLVIQNLEKEMQDVRAALARLDKKNFTVY